MARKKQYDFSTFSPEFRSIIARDDFGGAFKCMPTGLNVFTAQNADGSAMFPNLSLSGALQHGRGELWLWVVLVLLRDAAPHLTVAPSGTSRAVLYSKRGAELGCLERRYSYRTGYSISISGLRSGDDDDDDDDSDSYRTTSPLRFVRCIMKRCKEVPLAVAAAGKDAEVYRVLAGRRAEHNELRHHDALYDAPQFLVSRPDLFEEYRVAMKVADTDWTEFMRAVNAANVFRELYDTPNLIRAVEVEGKWYVSSACASYAAPPPGELPPEYVPSLALLRLLPPSSTGHVVPGVGMRIADDSFVLCPRTDTEE